MEAFLTTGSYKSPNKPCKWAVANLTTALSLRTRLRGLEGVQLTLQRQSPSFYRKLYANASNNFSWLGLRKEIIQTYYLLAKTGINEEILTKLCCILKLNSIFVKITTQSLSKLNDKLNFTLQWNRSFCCSNERQRYANIASHLCTFPAGWKEVPSIFTKKIYIRRLRNVTP